MQKYRSANLVLNFDICSGDGLSNMESAVQNCIAVSSLVSNYNFHLKVKLLSSILSLEDIVFFFCCGNCDCGCHWLVNCM